MRSRKADLPAGGSEARHRGREVGEPGVVLRSGGGRSGGRRRRARRQGSGTARRTAGPLRRETRRPDRSARPCRGRTRPTAPSAPGRRRGRRPRVAGRTRGQARREDRRRRGSSGRPTARRRRPSRRPRGPSPPRGPRAPRRGRARPRGRRAPPRARRSPRPAARRGRGSGSRRRSRRRLWPARRMTWRSRGRSAPTVSRAPGWRTVHHSAQACRPRRGPRRGRRRRLGGVCCGARRGGTRRSRRPGCRPRGGGRSLIDRRGEDERSEEPVLEVADLLAVAQGRLVAGPPGTPPPRRPRKRGGGPWRDRPGIAGGTGCRRAPPGPVGEDRGRLRGETALGPGPGDREREEPVRVGRQPGERRAGEGERRGEGRRRAGDPRGSIVGHWSLPRDDPKVPVAVLGRPVLLVGVLRCRMGDGPSGGARRRFRRPPRGHPVPPRAG